MNKKLNANLVKLVNLLSDRQYHDGTSIGDKLDMTRSAVWKAIKKLSSYQIRIDSVKGKGYALQEPLVLLDQNKIKKSFPHTDITIFENVNSTNTYLKAIKSDRAVVCLAEQQTHGRGRFNREWHSPFAKNIYFSCLYPFQKDVSELSGLSLVVGLAIVKTLKDCGIHKKLFVKWPNDIIYDNKKISGSLIEIQAETHGVSHTIIGVGVNVNMLKDEGKSISQAWTSMQQILGEYVDRNKVCVNLLDNFFDYLQRFESGGLQAFMDEWKKADGLFGQAIAVTSFTETIEGRAMGINEQGHLLLKMKNGKVKALPSGDTSIVKK